MTSIDVTDWAPAKVEGFLTAIRSDQPGVEISVTIHSDGQQRMAMALSDEPTGEYVARRCEVCQSITVAKVLPLDGIKARKALKVLNAAGETDSKPIPTHDHRNGDGPHLHRGTSIHQKQGEA
jgi:hypothetical protein